MDPLSAVREYYRCLDEHDYAGLEEVLSPDFVQYRPNRTFDSREAFVRFMREDRPVTDTEHAIDNYYGGHRGIAASGDLIDADGDQLFSFVDVFVFDDEGRIAILETFSDH